MKRCYVNSISQVSAQPEKWDEIISSSFVLTDSFTPSREISLKRMVSPMAARRMGKILRRAVYTSLTALHEAGVEMPDGIITATGIGCMENSERFLSDLNKFGEKTLKPTLFMQSTHNTIGSQIAMQLKCHGYNITYSHKGISFASALLDGLMRIESGRSESLLVGVHDEVTSLMAKILNTTHPEYDKIAECSLSSLLSSESGNALCELEDVRILHSPSEEELVENLGGVDHTLFLLGLNGKSLNNSVYLPILERLKENFRLFKPRFGDGYSSVALGFYNGVMLCSREEAERVVIMDCAEKDWSVIKLRSVKS